MNDMISFKVRDRVQLHQGGILMLVSEVNGDKAICTYVDKQGNPQRQEFLASDLKPYVEPKPLYKFETFGD